MRAGCRAAVTLDTCAAVPLRNHGSNTTLGVSRGAVLPGAVEYAVLLEDRNRQLIALLAIHRQYDLLDEGRCLDLLRRSVDCICPAFRNLYLDGCAHTYVNSLVVQINDLLTSLLEVGVVVILLHVLDCNIQRDDLGQCEECCLEDAVGALAQTDLSGQLAGVDDVELSMLIVQVTLHLCGQALFQLVYAPCAVEQVDTAVLEVFGGVVLGNIGRCVYSDEISCRYQIGGLDGLVAKTQVRLGQTARLHGVVREVCLCVLVCGQADGSNGVLVCANRTVAAQAPQLARYLARMSHLNLGVVERGMGYVVVDTDGEVVLGLVLCEVVINCNQLAGSGVLGGQTVTAADDLDVGSASLIECGAYVEVYRLTNRTNFLGAVENSDLLTGCRDGIREVLNRERAVQVNLHHTNLAAILVEVVYGLLECLGSRAHDNDDFLCVRCAVVVEQLVITAGQLVDLVHVVLNSLRNGCALDVCAFLTLEVDVRVYVVAAVGRVLGVERLCTECLEGIVVNQAAQVLVIQGLDALHLVRGAEAVKAVHECVLFMDGRQMCNRAEVHCLLGRGRHQHCIAGHTAGHKVGMIAEDGVMVRGDNARCDVHDVGQELAAHRVHRRDHQHQALRRGKGRRQCACLQRTVAGTCCASLGLHLDDVYGRTKQVLLALRRPLIHLFCHRRGRRDRVDRRDLSEGIGHMGGSRVTVHYGILFLHRISHLLYQLNNFILI